MAKVDVLIPVNEELINSDSYKKTFDLFQNLSSANGLVWDYDNSKKIPANEVTHLAGNILKVSVKALEGDDLPDNPNRVLCGYEVYLDVEFFGVSLQYTDNDGTAKAYLVNQFKGMVLVDFSKISPPNEKYFSAIGVSLGTTPQNQLEAGRDSNGRYFRRRTDQKATMEVTGLEQFSQTGVTVPDKLVVHMALGMRYNLTCPIRWDKFVRDESGISSAGFPESKSNMYVNPVGEKSPTATVPFTASYNFFAFTQPNPQDYTKEKEIMLRDKWYNSNGEHILTVYRLPSGLTDNPVYVTTPGNMFEKTMQEREWASLPTIPKPDIGSVVALGSNVMDDNPTAKTSLWEIHKAITDTPAGNILQVMTSDLEAQRRMFRSGYSMMAGGTISGDALDLSAEELRLLRASQALLLVDPTNNIYKVFDARGAFIRQDNGHFADPINIPEGGIKEPQPDDVRRITGHFDAPRLTGFSGQYAGAFSMSSRSPIFDARAKGVDEGGTDRANFDSVYSFSNGYASQGYETRPFNISVNYYIKVSNSPFTTGAGSKTYYETELNNGFRVFSKSISCLEIFSLDKSSSRFNNPMFSSDVPPPVSAENTIPALVDGAWTIIPDHRGKTFWENGEEGRGEWQKVGDLPTGVVVDKPLSVAIKDKINHLRIAVAKTVGEDYIYTKGDLSFKPQDYEMELDMSREIAQMDNLSEIVVEKISSNPIPVFDIQRKILKNKLTSYVNLDKFERETKVFEGLSLIEIENLDILTEFGNFIAN